MKKIDELIRDIDEFSEIPFMLKDELGDIYISPSFNAKGNIVETAIDIQDRELKILINKEEKRLMPLLTYYIKSNINDINYKKNMIIGDLLNGKEVNKHDLIKTYSFLTEKFNLITVYVEGNVHEAYTLIKEGYDEEDTVVLVYHDRLLIIGQLDSVYEHALSIKETLSDNISGKIIISFSSIDDYSKLFNSLKRCNNKILVIKRFNLETSIIAEDDIIFEEIIESIDIEKKNELMNKFSNGLRKIDSDMVKTIDMFFKCGLNLSEASKELYIHRNTLIYRIEKIQKYTGFDIRNFNEAVIFKTIYCLWKEENKII